MSNLLALANAVDSYVVNAIWQVPLVGGAAWAAARMLRRTGSRAQHVVWVSALVLAVVMPAVPVRRLVEMIPARQVESAGSVSVVTMDDIDLSALPAMDAPAETPRGVMLLPRGLVLAVLVGYLGAALYFALRLGWSLVWTWRLVRGGRELELSEEKRALWERCRASFGVERAELLGSAQVTGPVTMGLRRPVLLTPEEFAARCSEDELLAALAHECAHMRRRDFAKNVAYEAASVLIAFHPVTWMLKAQVAETREMVCDGAAAERLMDRQSYVQALLRMAGWVAAAQVMPGVGIFDGKTLERRVLTMKTKRREMSVAKRVALAAGGVTVMLAAASVSGWQAVQVEAKAEPVVAAPVADAVAVPMDTPVSSAVAGRRDVAVGSAMVGQTASTSAAATVPGDYAKWLDEDVRWIIRDDERAAFTQLKNDEERDAFEQAFWERRGAAAKDEHYRRIAFANDHYGYGSVPGWKSDRGMIYIKFGKPDSIDARGGGGEAQMPGGGQTVSFPYEVWHYKTIPGVGDGVDIQFVDQCQCGEYHSTLRPQAKLEMQGGQSARFVTVQDTAGAAVRGEQGTAVVYDEVHSDDGRYPPIAKAAHVSGAVKLTGVWNEDGTVANLKVVSGPQMLQIAAMDSMKTWKQTRSDAPNLKGPVDLKMTVMFNLEASPDGVRHRPMVGFLPANMAEARTAEIETAIAQMYRQRELDKTSVVHLDASVLAMRKTGGKDPVVPPIAVAAHVQGEVLLHVAVSAEGRVTDAQVVNGPQMLRQAALDAVKTWTYQPYLFDDKAVAVDATVSVRFGLNAAAQPQARTLSDGDLAELKSLYPQWVARQNAAPQAKLVQVAQQSDAQPVQISGGVVAGSKIGGDDPRYPADARAAHVQGAVVLHALISKEGKIENLAVLSGPEELRQASLDAVKTWTYKPYMLKGVPTEVETTITVNFTMTGGAPPPPPPPPQQQGVAPWTGPAGPAAQRTGIVLAGQSTVERLRQLYEQGVISRESYEQAVLSAQRPQAGGNGAGNGTTVQMQADTSVPPVMYRIGGEVSAPVVIHSEEPELSQQARAAKFAGNVVLALIVDAQGVPQDVHVVRGAGMGLDEKAIEAVKLYKFKPAMRQGQPVAVAMNVEVNFEIH